MFVASALANNRHVQTWLIAVKFVDTPNGRGGLLVMPTCDVSAPVVAQPHPISFQM